MAKKVYIVAISGVETFCIKHICASEKTARRRFKELKVEMLGEELEFIVSTINEYKNHEGIYSAKYSPTQEECDRSFEFDIMHNRERIKLYTDCTFEAPARSIHTKPVCEIYDLEE